MREPKVLWWPFTRLDGGPADRDDPHAGQYLDIDWDEDEGDYVHLPIEVATRELVELKLDDTNELCAFLWSYGLVLPDRLTQPEEINLDYVRGQLRTARLLALHCLAYLEDGDVTAPWAEAFGGVPSSNVDFPDFSAEDDAWVLFLTAINSALGDLGPRVEYLPAAYVETETFIGDPGVDLYTGLCVQIFNLFVEGLPTRRCANETCGRNFVRQRDRAEHGQHRTTGVAYCSRACARAQAKRAARRAKSDHQKTERKKGST